MPVINFRTDPVAERNLAELTSDGSSTSDAIRQALADAVKFRRREQMRREALEVMSDPAELAEMRAVQQEMEQLSAW